ncbi:MAG: phosphoribosylamine--glycine ligase [Gammaproteobacteria bacterium]
MQEKNRVLIVGSGGREHAFTWKISLSDKVERIFVAPGNAGTSQEHKTTNIDISPNDIPALIQFSIDEQINLVIVGPEDPLVNGITDQFNTQGINCFGPSSRAAQLEGSKDYSKAFMHKYEIPTADYSSFENIEEAKRYVANKTYPLVIKADGLAAGKGVVIIENLESAVKTIDEFMDNEKYGQAGKKIIIEEFLTGQELSFIVIVNGNEVLPLATSQDHKTIGEGDVGLNTGGMGAFSPVPFVNKEINQKILDKVIIPTVNGLHNEGIHYRGFLYAGLMIDKNLEPKVLEYNCRFGDPETQPIMMRLNSDLIDLIDTSFKGGINKFPIKWNTNTALGVVMSSKGYPEKYETGKQISGLSNFNNAKNLKIFHSGTTLDNDKILTDGGRVLCVTALGSDIKTSKALAYSAVSNIDWDGCYCRKDIGFRVIE